MRHAIYIMIGLAIFLVTGCVKPKPPRNFFSDQNNPGLSRFTDYGYNIASNYINNVAYTNPYLPEGNALPVVYKTVTTSQFDTLTISWQIAPDTAVQYNFFPQYTQISILLPINKNFSGNDFLALDGQRFPANTCTLNLLQQNSFSEDTLLAGTANIYFVKMGLGTADNSPGQLMFSGLFSGNIGDSIIVGNGRFDFSISVTSLNF
jgi:hypothetical protein